MSNGIEQKMKKPKVRPANADELLFIEMVKHLRAFYAGSLSVTGGKLQRHTKEMLDGIDQLYGVSRPTAIAEIRKIPHKLGHGVKDLNLNQTNPPESLISKNTLQNAIGARKTKGSESFTIETKCIVVWYIVKKMNWLPKKCFLLKTIQGFKDEVEKSKMAFENKAPSSDATTISIGPVRNSISSVGESFFKTFVTYRFSIENDPGESRISREIVTFKAPSYFGMTFKPGPIDDGSNFHTCSGTIFVASPTIACLGTNGSMGSPRLRALVMGHTVVCRKGCRFALMSTARAVSPHQPCGACVIMIPLQFELADHDRAEFEHEVTTFATLDSILDRDFKGLRPELAKDFRVLLDNRPRGSHIDVPQTNADYMDKSDPVLMLHNDVFINTMSAIVAHVLTNKIAAPFAERWRDGLLSKNNTDVIGRHPNARR